MSCRKEKLAAMALVTVCLSAPASVHASSGVMEALTDGVKSAFRIGNDGLGARGDAAKLWSAHMSGDREALDRLGLMARRGNPEAKAILGYAFDNGIGVPRDSARAASYFSEAKKKVPLAAYNLGVLLKEGRGVPADPREALTAYQQADGIGPAAAMAASLLFSQGRTAEALEWSERAAKWKSSYGTYLHARLLLDTGREKQGLIAMRKAASMNYPDAIDALVYLYQRGVGTKPDYAMAAGYWIIGQVGKGIANEDQASELAKQFGLPDHEHFKAVRFARRWLLGRAKYTPFDFSRTLEPGDLSKKGS